MAAPPGASAAAAELPGEASCPVCRELLREPVSIHCGHHFCRGCIGRRWEWATGAFACPQCRQTAPRPLVRPSPELARLLEVAKRLSLQVARRDSAAAAEEEEEEEEEEGCERHQEPLKVFCKDDETFLCRVCRESRVHRAHTVLPVPEAVREYKGEIEARLQVLKDTREKLLGSREVELRRSWEYLGKAQAARQRLLARFEGLRLVLEDHARRLLAQLGHLERDIEAKHEENLTSLTKEISRLDTLIQEVEKKCEQPANGFLQDIGGTLSRLEKENFQQPPMLLPELEKKLSRFGEENQALEETLRSFQDALMFQLPEKMQVTLDPSTAHPQLIVSADGRSVRWAEAQQDPSAEGSDPDPCVLARESVTSGRCCWEVEVTPNGSWAVGVARESLKRREVAAASPEMELWSMGQCEGQFWALTSLRRVPLHQTVVPRRVRVSLDHQRGQVAFFDAEKQTLIFAFPAASFEGERVHPWFLVWGEGSQMTLCP